MRGLRAGDRGRRGAPVADPKHVVRAGYDTIADRYAVWSASFETPVGEWLARLVEQVPAGGRVLELGCGGENPSTRELASRYEYVGVDISSGQLERARRAFPGARFVLGDASAVELEADSFDGVVSLFMLGHVPRAEQGPLLRRIAAWLRPRGWLLATLGTADAAGMVEDDWLGAPMFFASFDEETNRRLLTGAGFELVDARVVPFEEPGPRVGAVHVGAGPAWPGEAVTMRRRRLSRFWHTPSHTRHDFAGTLKNGGKGPQAPGGKVHAGTCAGA